MKAQELPLIIPETYEPRQAVKDAIDMVGYALTHAIEFTPNDRTNLRAALFHMQRVME